MFRIRGEKRGIVAASAGSAGSVASRTPKRATQRAKRKFWKKVDSQQAQSNPAGSKRLRQYYKAATGNDSQHTELAVARGWYAQLAEPTYRQGESSRRIAAGTAW